MEKLTKKDFLDIIEGAAFLGSGGGGSIEAGKNLLDISLMLSEKDEFPFIENIDVLESDTIVAVIADFGSIQSSEEQQYLAIQTAYRKINELSVNMFHKEIGALLPIETGSENTIVPFVISAFFNIPVLNADGAGRAVPLIQLTSYTGFEVPISPVVITNDKYETIVIDSKEPEHVEDILRKLSEWTGFNNSGSIALYLSEFKNIKNSCIKNTITNSKYIGSYFRSIRENDFDLYKKSFQILEDLNFYYFGSGTVIDIKNSLVGSLDTGLVKIKIENQSEYFTIYTQNENLILFSSSKLEPLIVAPDSICYLREDFLPITNSEIKIGNKIHIVGVQSNPKLRSNYTINCFQKLLETIGYAGNIPFLEDKYDLQKLNQIFPFSC